MLFELVVIGSVSVVDLNGVVCVCWLVVCPAHLNVGISVVDEVISDVPLSFCCKDGEDGDVAVVDNVVSSVEPLSSVDDSNVDVLVGVITVVNVD